MAAQPRVSEARSGVPDGEAFGREMGGYRGCCGGGCGPRRRRGAAAAAPVEEKTEFTVVLAAAGDKKIELIKEVRALTGSIRR
jgi:hypothetical protein